jgi:hypothetical protein
MERNDARTPQSSFSDDNESVEERSFQPTSSGDEKEDENDDDSVEQLVKRTNRIVIDSDGDSNTRTIPQGVPNKRPPATKTAICSRLPSPPREVMGTETFVTLTTLLSAEDWSAKVTLRVNKLLQQLV